MHFLDTNVIIWLAQGEVNLLSPQAKSLIESNDVFISPLVKLELEYLYEVKRIKLKSENIIQDLYEAIGLQMHNVPVSLLIENAISQKWTRDPFDRLITAHAQMENAFLITKDDHILKNYKKAVW